MLTDVRQYADAGCGETVGGKGVVKERQPTVALLLREVQPQTAIGYAGADRTASGAGEPYHSIREMNRQLSGECVGVAWALVCWVIRE
jgi:hypothetical protein